MTASNGTIRYHSLDALRAFALLLGIVFHASESFIPYIPAGEWAIKDVSENAIPGVFFYTCHIFRLQLFFVMSGFFAHLVYHKRGAGVFIRQRLMRIGVPLIAGWAIIFPMLVYIWILGAMKSGVGMEQIPLEAADLPPLVLTIGAIVSLGVFEEGINLTHLWFLYYLLMLYAIVLALRFVLDVFLDRGERVRRRLDRIFAWIVRSPWNVVIFAIPTIPSLLIMGTSFGVRTPNESLAPDAPVVWTYLLFFGLGWLLHRQVDLLSAFLRRWPIHLTAALILLAPLFVMFDRGLSTDALYILYFSLYALDMWLWVFGFIGLFLQFCGGESRRRRYIADSSYWLYILHLPLVTWLQVQFAHLEWNWVIKFALINVITFPILFLSYHYFVRSTFIGQVLNGRKYPFQRLIFKRRKQLAET
ncbi:MAG: acyltransferase family protein [Candidatus Omnitrophica bacterium]|nr:acyltransferase family protein [Candidatus Omnitrophota bacterium]